VPAASGLRFALVWRAMPFPDFTPTLPVFLRTTAERFGPRTLLVSDGERLSYADAESRSRALAKGLLAQGIGKGTHVGLWMPNRVDWVVTWFALTRIGALSVPLNTFYQAKELEWTVRHADLSHLLCYARFMSHDYLARLETALDGLASRSAESPLYLRAAPYLRAIHVWGECDRRWARGGEAALAAAGRQAGLDDAFLAQIESGVTPADPMLIVYSSGSTAEPKGAVHTHGTLVRHSFNLADSFKIGADVLYSPMPFFWIGGIITGLFMVMHHGGTLVTHGAFEPGATLELLERERVSQVMGWPHYGKTMSQHPTFASRDLSLIRRSNMPDLQAKEKQPPEIRSNSLGMTETCGPHTNFDAYVALPEKRRGTFGLPLEGVSHRVVDPATGEVLPPGKEGEICVRGYSVMQGLYKIEREQAFDADGFYHTGDGGWFDEEGWLFFKGRLGEMVKTGGANVTPSEVEAVLMTYPEVLEAYVTGIADADRGQLVVAAVVPRGGHSVDAEGLRVRLKADLSAYKVPRHIWVCAKEELPFTDSGKIRKPALAERIAKLFGDA
jgi:acyl-CoA synthetase (AMP-forming)/AMP-acid ligase II